MLGGMSVVLVAAASLLAAAVSPLLPTQGAGALVRHQMEGLAHPLDQKKSTLRTHIGLVREGIQTAFTKPLGSGSGAASLAGAKFGSGTFVTEADPSNAAVAWGIPGLLAYLVVAAAGLRTAYRQARLRRGGLELAVLGLLIVSFLQWLNGGYYAVSLLPWLALGWLDRDSEALT